MTHGYASAAARLNHGAEGEAAARYRALEAGRRPYLQRAREAARLTVPALLPPEAATPSSDLPTPYQGVGARGVNNLASKLLLAQFPPNTPFFRLVACEAVTAAAAAADHASGDGARLTARLEAGLQRVERDVMREIEAGFFRAALFAALKQLIVAGNALLHAPPDGGLRVFRLDRYVARRDAMGRLAELVVKEHAPAESLPEACRGAALDGQVAVYTWLRRDAGGWAALQEAAGVILPGGVGRYPVDGCEWMALRWAHVDGEDYGRGHVEEYIGDLKSLEGLTQAIVEGAAAASKMTVLVSPNGVTDAEALAEAENGAIIDGDAADVTILQAGKSSDFRVAFDAARQLSDRLGFAFLLNSALRRDADRVTAAEIRFVAAELEDALGGVYSVLAEELQKPLVEALLAHQARRGGAGPALPPGVIKPLIVTGLDALGRGHDLHKLETFLAFAGSLGGLAATPVGALLDLEPILLRAGAAIGVDPARLLRRPQARGCEALSALGPDLIARVRAATSRAAPAFEAPSLVFSQEG